MKIFKMNCGKHDEKINFVDHNNVFVGFDYATDCCESFGYFISENPNCIYEDAKTHSEDELKPYYFDPTYYRKFCLDEDGEQNFVQFKLKAQQVTDKNTVGILPPLVLYLTLFNHHNGYYGHGFAFCRGETFIVDDAI